MDKILSYLVLYCPVILVEGKIVGDVCLGLVLIHSVTIDSFHNIGRPSAQFLYDRVAISEIVTIRCEKVTHFMNREKRYTQLWQSSAQIFVYVLRISIVNTSLLPYPIGEV